MELSGNAEEIQEKRYCSAGELILCRTVSFLGKISDSHCRAKPVLIFPAALRNHLRGFLHAVQAHWSDIAAGGNPCRLIRKADRRKSKSADKSQTDNRPRQHLHHAGENSSSRVAETLCYHTADIQNTKCPVEKSETAQIFCGSINRINSRSDDKELRQ